MVEFRLDKRSAVPFYRQIVDMVLSGVASGAISPGDQLPTIRDLAVRLEVNPNTVVKAYSHLAMLGVLDSQQGSGVYVRPQALPERSREDHQRDVESLCRDFVGRAQLLGISIDELLACLGAMQRER